MSIESINSHEVLEFLKSEAAHFSSKRFVCFTKVWLSNEFVVMMSSDSSQEVFEFFMEQPNGSRELSPRLIFDQLEGIITNCHNEELVLSTMDVITVNKEQWIRNFIHPTGTWSKEKYLERGAVASVE